VSGEENTPVMRAAVTADFGNGTSAPLDFRYWTYINADLTLNLTRLPQGSWILSDARSWLDREGRGIAIAKLADEAGHFGLAAQSLLISKRTR
jgi:hypothetical protein